jgi:hypothetical protein
MKLAVFGNHIRLDSGLVRRRGAQVPSLNGVATEIGVSKKEYLVDAWYYPGRATYVNQVIVTIMRF